MALGDALMASWCAYVWNAQLLKQIFVLLGFQHLPSLDLSYFCIVLQRCINLDEGLSEY